MVILLLSQLGMFPQSVLWQALNQFVVPLLTMKLVHFFDVN